MLTIVIPTLQKNKETLYTLIDTLDLDSSVGEIIVIDNSLKGIENISTKLRVITPEENLYVNPSWNLGVRKAQNQKIGLLNDDIIISEDFCTQISKFITPEIGILGMNFKNVIQINKVQDTPKSTTIQITPIKYRDFAYGTALFFHKNSFHEIPDEMKITYGDDWIFEKNLAIKKQNYKITGQNIYHLGSISSGLKTFNPVCKNDAKVFKKLTMTWKKRFFSFQEYYDCFKLRFLGLTLKFKKGKNAR